MKRTILCFAFLFQIAAQQTINSQAPKDTRQQFAMLGNFLLENGQHIADCKIGYRTLGKLNSTRSNAVIYPTAGGTTTFMMEAYLGAGADVDTSRFYLILIDALGNGVSSSPSNSIGQPKTLFPEFNIRDMVNAEYKVVTENLNIHHLTAVAGVSLGGLQSLQWAVSYPDFMDKVVAIEATPRVSSYDLLWMNTYIEAVKSDTAYHDGNYTVNPTSPLAAYLTQLILTTPANLNNTVPVDSFSTWFASLGKYSFSDCNDFLSQVKAVLKHDITAKTGGSLEKAAKMIRAKMLIVANKQDHLFNQALSIKLAEITNAKLVVMDNDLGHLASGEKISIETTRSFLSQ